MKKIVAIALILIGISLLLSPMIIGQVVKYYNKTIMNRNTIAINDAEDIDAEFDFSAINDVDMWTLLMASKNFDKKLIIGTIMIPDLDIHLPIVKGLTNINLAVGAATMKADQNFGHGNYTLAGHYMKNRDLLFGSLMDIEIGNRVYLSNGDIIYEYHIYDTIVVPDTQMDMLSDNLADERGKPTLSLMTCYHSSKTGKRFFALGELVDEHPAK